MASNIEKFDTTVVLALAELYARFPMRYNLSTNKFMLTDDGLHEEGFSPREEAYLDVKDPYFVRKEFAFECVNWLVEAGYVNGKPVAYSRIENAVLSAKGLALLKATPNSLQEGLGEKLQAAVKNGIGATGRALITQLVTLGVKYVG